MTKRGFRIAVLTAVTVYLTLSIALDNVAHSQTVGTEASPSQEGAPELSSAPEADQTPETETFKTAGEFDPAKLAEQYGLPERLLDPNVDKSTLELLLLPLTEHELGAASAAWQQIVKGQTEEVVEASLTIEDTSGELAHVFRARVAELVEERRGLFENFMLVVTDWEKKGGDADQIEKYRLYRSSILIDEIRKADAETLYQRTLKWMLADDGGIEVAIDATVIVGSLFLLFITARVLRGFARGRLRKFESLSHILQAFIVSVIYWLTVVIGLMFVLSVLGVDITPMFALVGGASFVIAFAMQETIANFFSGLMIMMNRPFDEGDYVDLEGGRRRDCQKDESDLDDDRHHRQQGDRDPE